MQLPNKLYSYKKSTLALIPDVLIALENERMPVKRLYSKIRPHLSEATDFLSVMDCLYALRAIDMSDDGEVFRC